MAFVTGMDIGYGNLKIAFGDAMDPAPICEIYPACAVPAELVATSLFTEDSEDETGIHVEVSGKSWMAGVPGNLVAHHPRHLHEGYVGSDAWTALAYAGILMTGQTVIDKLVVGLPVQHYEVPERRQALKDILQGVHAVLPVRSIEVREVQVVPQPVGTYVEAINSDWCPEPVQERLAEETSLVVDPGFFSLDWTLIRAGGMYSAMSSGSSLFAVSLVLTEARKIIADRYGKAPTVTQLESCLQNGREHIYVFNQDVQLPPILEQAAQMVGRKAFSEMRETLRQVEDPMNFILLAGGGARLYAPMAQEVYPDSQILMAEQPELANARGFWHLGAQSFV